MKNLYLLAFFLSSIICSAQGNSAASASIDKTAILIGEQLQLTLQAAFPAGTTPAFNLPDSIPHFEVLQLSKIDTQTSANKIFFTQTVTLTSWDSGQWQIPAITFSKGHTTKPLTIQVGYSAMSPDQDYHDAKDIMDVQLPARTTWYWYVLGALLLLLLLILIFPKNKKETKGPVINANAYQQAMKQLDALQKQNGDSKLYFTELILIFRTYLQQGKNIHSFQKTTDDIAAQLKELPMQHEDYKKLVTTLQLSDFVKFARYEATDAEKKDAANTIKNSITIIEGVKV